MRALTLLTVGALAAPVSVASAAEPINIQDDAARVNYSVGFQIGGDFKRQGVELRPEAIVKGIEDALSGGKPLLEPQEMQATLVELKRKVLAEQRARQREAELEKVAAGRKFLEENAQKPGVVTTASGLQYRVIAEGSGKTPSPTDEVTVNYRGTLINGNEFDSSYGRGEPVTFRLDGVIKGWTEGLQLVREGGKIQLFIPSELAYGDRGPLAQQTLIFDVELLSVGGKKPAEVPQGTQPSSNP